MKDTRPSPEDILRKIEAEESSKSVGRLKIFLGYAPRVGKSQRMFDEGRRRKERGQDVVVGAVQLKGSDELGGLINEFELIPALHGGGVDVAAILRRKPQVCLMDELARDNPPGSPRPHRWQDVEELRAHGVNVVGALNLQHIREQQDDVEHITGRRSVVGVPESFVLSADEIVIVDIPEETLPQTTGLNARQLAQLREAALLMAAQVVEHQLQRYMESHCIQQSWGTQERILVCITPQRSARAMLESGARAAAGFHGQLLAVHVKNGEAPREYDELIQELLAYARTLGAEIHVLDGPDAMGEIIRFTKEQRITQIFLGHTRQSPWKFWKPNPVDRLIRAAEGMDVRIFPAMVSA
ncbi:MAG TPA: hypothetical protein VNH18_17740 [Bryobacteraceae bacterium]|nr:hypothetical protein [Bryobacteraceae bacterium]